MRRIDAPAPDEIAAAREAIKASWSPDERLRRSYGESPRCRLVGPHRLTLGNFSRHGQRHGRVLRKVVYDWSD